MFILLFFESINFLFLAVTAIFRNIDQLGFPQISFLASTALFPLMALFIYLDNDRYKVYIPLFTAGKCIGLFSLLCWFVFSVRNKTNTALSGTVNIEPFLLLGYLFSMIVILLIIRDKKLDDEKISNENKLEVV